MRHLRQLLLLLVLCSVVATGYAQDDSNKYRKKDLEQLEQYEDGDYLFPPQPRNNWSVGVKGGLAYIAGDVKAQPGYGLGIDIRKAMGHAFSFRFQLGYGQAFGLNYQPTNGYKNHAGNPWDEAYYPDRVNAITDVPLNVPNVYYNFRMTYGDASIQGLVNLNNINFYKEQSRWNVYAGAGLGLMAYQTRVNALDAGNLPYDFRPVTAIPLNSGTGLDGRSMRLDELDRILDDTYETPAEGHSDEQGLEIGGNRYVVNPLVTGIVGLRFRLTRRIELELEHRISWANDDLLDGQRWQEVGGDFGVDFPFSVTSLTRDFDSYNLTSLGIHVRLGPGEDGLWWSNPLNEVYSAAQESRQIVQKLTDDTDNDGVPDLYDKEPDTPENTPVDGQGRTLDNDGDGYPDIEDDEPFSLKGCPVDNNGVMIDEDNDGTPDCIDKEPNSPPGHYYDKKGVAIILPDNTSNTVAETPCLLPIIHFDLDRDIIKPEFYPELYYIAQVMKSNPDVKVRAIGHTDVRNTDAYNQDLSKRRVNNAVDFLVNTYGINRNRFDMDYKGENSNLIEKLPDNHSNKSLEPLHYVNRRVEFECVQQ
ncbi:MAG: OmpA family protein [Bacteroidota bacterium]